MIWYCAYTWHPTTNIQQVRALNPLEYHAAIERFRHQV